MGVMSFKNPKFVQKRPAVVASVAASWVSLLAVTTLGVAALQHVRAQVSADPRELAKERSGPGEYRLIVQSYAPSSVIDGVPVPRARPYASAQRPVTAAELADGIGVDVVDLEHAVGGDQVLVAWVERGSADLDFDARRARPMTGAYLGVASAADGSAEHARIVLTRRIA
jgi:hypothetical protein